MRVLGHAASINVRKVLWTLDELGLAHQREDWGASFAPTRQPDFLALNPNGLIPVLVDDLGSLWESNTICRYLAQRHGGGTLLPPAARDRALIEQWMDWQATELNGAWRYAFLALVRKTPGFDDPAAIAASITTWNAAMTLLDRQLATTGAYAAGETFSLADVVLGLSTHRWLMTPIDHADLPAVRAYYDRLRARAAFPPHARADVP
ncbi:glutathione S-transferase family protein [Caulobacter henricii]|uniref:Glutathione S-transferase n=1 Tax=Caulobacter henricii TaxID=69395 RepID=A0A0P0P0N8_9CAUL|nr:glutathione S-transferase [Caulobacter henricii]ALL14089.1 glutathione S-transferase [Caulobacter henricii]